MYVVLAVAAVLVIALTKREQRNRSGVAISKIYPSRNTFEKSEVSASNLKAAARKVDNSATRVEVALKTLMAA